MSTLKEILKDVHALEELLLENNGELVPVLQDWMTINENNLKTKVDSYAYFVSHLENGAEYFKQKSIEATNARKIYENQILKLKEYLKIVMTELTTDELKGEMYRYKLVKSKPVVIIKDEMSLPAIYMNEKIELYPDKESIKKDIENGIKIPGAELQENYALKCFLNKG